MKSFLIVLLLFGTLQAKIYDCFNFFNETSLLKIRLAELADNVDYFVIVEAKDTFTGKNKPLYFSENKKMFEEYLPKIIHVVVEKSPQFTEAIDREHFQRDQIMRGLTNCNEEDVILISDVDEIVRKSCLKEMISLIRTNPGSRFYRILPSFLRKKLKPVIGCGCDFYRWFFNRKDESGWVGTSITTYGFLIKKSPQKVRDLREKFYVFPKGGWHFSNMGGYEMFLKKIVSFSDHKECEGLLKMSPDQIYGTFSNLSYVEIDSSYPQYVLDHYEELDSEKFFDKGQYN